MGTFSNNATDRRLEREGVPLQTSSGGTFVCRRLGASNVEHQKYLERKLRPLRRAAVQGKLSLEVRQQIELDAFVDTILVGWWEDVTWPVDDEGRVLSVEDAQARLAEGQELDERPLPFSRDHARMLLAALPDLYDELAAMASAPECFRAEGREADAKNS